MIPQGYELWLAEVVNDGDPAPVVSGRVIGWHLPVDLAKDTEGAWQIVPVVCYEDSDTGRWWPDVADDPWFLGSTQQEAIARARRFLDGRPPEVDDGSAPD